MTACAAMSVANLPGLGCSANLWVPRSAKMAPKLEVQAQPEMQVQLLVPVHDQCGRMVWKAAFRLSSQACSTLKPPSMAMLCTAKKLLIGSSHR